MADPFGIEELDQRISEIKTEIRKAVSAQDFAQASQLRTQLRALEAQWHGALELAESSVPGKAGKMQLPVRETVHQILTLLAVPAAPRTIVAVHAAFFAGELAGSQLTYLRRDEERSFRATPHGRPYYLCSALTYDRLTAARGLIAVSSWPLHRRIVGTLSARVDYLRSAINLAGHIDRTDRPSPSAQRLLWQVASGIPNASATFGDARPASVIEAAEAELSIHDDDDRVQREQAARRARKQLGEAEQLFGAGQLTALSAVRKTR